MKKILIVTIIFVITFSLAFSATKTILSEGENNLGGGIFAEKKGKMIAVILPERLYAKTDGKLLGDILLIMPKIYGSSFWKKSVDSYNKPNVENRNEVNIIYYTMKDSSKICILVNKDPDLGVYGFSTWIE